MSNDLRDIDSRSKEILLNREIIAVNQDRLGKQGKRVVKDTASFTEVWFRPLAECGSVAVVLLSLRADLPVEVPASFSDVGISTKRAYARDLFAHQELGVYQKNFKAKVNPNGVVMVRLTPICDEPKTPKKDTKRKAEETKEETSTNTEKESSGKTEKVLAAKTGKKKVGKREKEPVERPGKKGAEKTDKKRGAENANEKKHEKTSKNAKKPNNESVKKTDKSRDDNKRCHCVKLK